MAAKTEIRTRFQEQLKKLIATGAVDGQASRNLRAGVFAQIDLGEWDGDLFDWEGISKAFDRDEHRADIEACIADTANPGTVGDIMAGFLQGELLAIMERSFRARHTNPLRRRLQAGARRAGHGNPDGVLQRGVLGPLEDLLKQAKG